VIRAFWRRQQQVNCANFTSHAASRQTVNWTFEDSRFRKIQLKRLNCPLPKINATNDFNASLAGPARTTTRAAE